MRLILRAIAVIATVLVVILLAEIYLRQEVTYVTTRQLIERGGLIEANPEFLVLTTERGRRLVPNTQAVIKNHFLSHRDIAIDTNELGFRSLPLGSRKPFGETRIMFIGDSITLADSVSSDETFVSQVQQKLEGSKFASNVRTINAGVGNSGLAEEVNLLEDTVKIVNPDIVVTVFYLNDSRPPWGFSGEIGDRGWWRRHSILVDSIYRMVMQRIWSEKVGRPQFEWIDAQKNLDWVSDHQAFMQLVEAARFDWGAAWQPDSMLEIEKQLDRITKLAKRYKFKTAFILAPVSYQIEAQFLDDVPQQRMIEQLKRRGIPTLDLLPKLRDVYRESGDQEKLLFDQCHFTVSGNRVVAQEIAEFLLTLK